MNALLELQERIDGMASARSYRPLAKRDRAYWYDLYEHNLNGFDLPGRSLTIDGLIVAHGYSRVVIGDFGAYVEISMGDLAQRLEIEPGQEWRLDKSYLETRGLNIKYEWYHFNGRKVYYQLATVKYADYRPGFYYVSVLYFD